ncbi:MAG TPA: CcmD family protein [Candidatus Limnocylindria bacterium]|nr:CcmD family protein [Candidatus Limnocylindria bacterium]
MMHLGYLAAAYAVVIGGIALYLRRLVARLAAVDRELSQLRSRLDAADRR